jgi:hypothetical protein
MVTDLRHALREAAATGPAGDADLARVVASGGRRVRRHRAALGVAVATAAAIVVTVASLPHGVRRTEPPPAETPHLRLKDVPQVRPEVLQSLRNTNTDPDSLDYDRFDGLTDDGLVARARYTYEGDRSEFGLLDLETGDTDWLPKPTWDIGEPTPVDLSADRLLYLDNRHYPGLALLAFDRQTQTWTHRGIDVSADKIGRFFGAVAELGPDDRVYLSDGDESGSSWWSVPSTGGQARPEPDLDDMYLVWGTGGERATADTDGRVVVTRAGGDQVVTTTYPQGCVPELEEFPPEVMFAGQLLVVYFLCQDGPQLTVYDQSGKAKLVVEGGTTQFRPVAGIDGRILLEGLREYVIDLQDAEIRDIGGGSYVAGSGLLGDLVFWSPAGPDASEDVYDVIYKVARLP